jgi:hypothetical protein
MFLSINQLKIMNKVIMVMFCFIAINSYSQEKDTIPNLVPFEDSIAGLFVSKVVEISDKSQKDLVTQFKNWASTSFVNLREVIVSETENQLVLNYVTKTTTYIKTLGLKSLLDYSWYVRMVVQFKDGKVRARFYDDGNVFKEGEYNKYGSIPSVAARSFFIRTYTEKPENIKDLHRSHMNYDMHLIWQKNVLNMAKSFEDGMRNTTIISKKDDF